MIIRRKILREDGVILIHTFSDSEYKIRKKGTEEVYVEALDVLDFDYEETTEKIDE